MVKDIDARLDSKAAEFETLSRATASLLEQHTKLRDDFAVELTDKAKKASKDLDKELKVRRKELFTLNNEVSGSRLVLEETEKLLSEKQKEILEQNSKFSREKEGIIEILARLNSEKITLEGERTMLEKEKASLTTDIDRLHTERASVQEKIRLATDELAVVEMNLEDAGVSYEFKKNLYDQEEAEAKRRLSIINSQLNNASRSLHEVKTEEDNIRTDLADLSMQLGKREEAIRGREAKVAQQEKRVFNYSKFTGL